MSDMGTQIRDYLDATTAPLGAKEIIMGSTFTEERDDAPASSSHGWRWVAAVAAAAAVVAAVWLLPGGGDEATPIDDPDGQSAPTTPVEVVEAAVDAYNDGSVEALAALVAFDPEERFEFQFNPPGHAEARMAAGAVFVLDEPCAATGQPGEVRCTGVDTNDFWAPAGLSKPGVWTVVVEDGRIVSEEFGAASNALRLTQYGNAFFAWLADAHPDVYASLPEFDEVGDGGRSIHPMSWGASGFPVADAVPTVLQYVEEFVAQSPDYPITP